jgi:hypothetical protein
VEPAGSVVAVVAVNQGRRHVRIPASLGSSSPKASSVAASGSSRCRISPAEGCGLVALVFGVSVNETSSVCYFVNSVTVTALRDAATDDRHSAAVVGARSATVGRR